MIRMRIWFVCASAIAISACSLVQDPALDEDQALQAITCRGGNHVLQAPATALNNQNIRFDACVSLVKAQHGLFDPTTAVARVVARHSEDGTEILMDSVLLNEASFAGFTHCWNTPTARECHFNFYNFRPLPSGTWNFSLQLDGNSSGTYDILTTKDVAVVTAPTTFQMVDGPVICQGIGGTEPPFSCVQPLSAAPGSDITLPAGDTDYFALVRFKVSGDPVISASTVGLSSIEGAYSERFFPWGAETHVQAWFHSHDLALGVRYVTTFSVSGTGAEPQYWPAPAVRSIESH